jgi:hypothetical protein
MARFDISALKTPPTPGQALDYIHEMLGELIPMATIDGIPPVVAYLLGMAKVETEGLLRLDRHSRPQTGAPPP